MSGARAFFGSSVADPDLRPQDIGMLGWSHPPHLSMSTASMSTAGRLHLVRIKRVPAATITNIVTLIAGAGVTLANCYAALYSAAGALLGQTADQATSWQSTGTKTMPLNTPYANPATQDLYVGWWWNGTTAPTLGRMASNNTTSFNMTLATPNLVSAFADTGLTTTAPATFGAQTAAATHYYWGLS